MSIVAYSVLKGKRVLLFLSDSEQYNNAAFKQDTFKMFSADKMQAYKNKFSMFSNT